MKFIAAILLPILFAWPTWAKNEYDAQKIISAASMGANVTSTCVDMNNTITASIQAIWTGATANGTLQLQTSNDIASSCSGVTNWSTYTNSQVFVVGAGNFTWVLDSASYRWLELVYTETSGTGTLNATFGRKLQ